MRGGLRGFTLVEVLVALAVLAIALTAVMRTMAQACCTVATVPAVSRATSTRSASRLRSDGRSSESPRPSLRSSNLNRPSPVGPSSRTKMARVLLYREWPGSVARSPRTAGSDTSGKEFFVYQAARPVDRALH